MANLIDFNSFSITHEELSILQGGTTKYYIGTTEVTKEIYKDYYLCKTGNVSAN